MPLKSCYYLLIKKELYTTYVVFYQLKCNIKKSFTKDTSIPESSSYNFLIYLQMESTILYW